MKDMEEVISSTLEKIGEAKKTGRVVAILLATGAALICITVLFFKLRKQAKELAKLRHERNVQEEKAHQELVNESLAKNEAEKQAHMQEVDKHMDVVDELDKKIEEIYVDKEKTKDLIDTLVTWDDVEAYLNGEK